MDTIEIEQILHFGHQENYKDVPICSTKEP